VTQKREIIKLIPKKDAEPDLIKYWRLITLLNCGYKIGNSDQTGFVKGRFIGENIRLIDSVIHFAGAKNNPGLLLFLDFEKAFDSLNWSFIRITFKHLNVG